MKEEVISLEDIFYSLKAHYKMIIAITVITTLIAGIFSFFIIKPTYEGKVKIFIGKEGASSGQASDYSSADVTMYQNLMKTYAEVIKTKDSTKKALNAIGADTSSVNVNRVLSGLTVSPGANTQIMDVTYKTKNKDEIVQILTATTNSFMAQSKDLIPNGNVQIIQAPEIPTEPIAPNKMMNIAIGFLLGLMVSVGIAFLKEYLDSTFKKPEDLEDILGIPVIGVIPEFSEVSSRKNRHKKERK